LAVLYFRSFFCAVAPAISQSTTRQEKRRVCVSSKTSQVIFSKQRKQSMLFDEFYAGQQPAAQPVPQYQSRGVIEDDKVSFIHIIVGAV
jgi:hypothetical protein